MKLVFLIDKNPMIRDYLEQYLPTQGFKVYSLSSVQDADYLIRDLAPSLLVWDSETVNDEEFLSRVAGDIKNIPLITLGKNNRIKNSLAHFDKPLDPVELKNFLIKNFSLN